MRILQFLLIIFLFTLSFLLLFCSSSSSRVPSSTSVASIEQTNSRATLKLWPSKGVAAACERALDFASDAVLADAPEPLMRYLRKSRCELHSVSQLISIIRALPRHVGGRSVHDDDDGLACALVGGSANILGTNVGAEIDSHSVVFRTNTAPMGGQYAADVGSRGTLRMVDGVQGAPPLVALAGSAGASAVLTPNQSIAIFTTVDYVRLNASFNAYYASRFGRNVPALLLHDGLWRPWLEAVKSIVDQDTFENNPSTGFQLFFAAMLACDRVNVYGYGGGCAARLRANHCYHYYNTGLKNELTHRMDVEDYIITLAANGLLRVAMPRHQFSSILARYGIDYDRFVSKPVQRYLGPAYARRCRYDSQEWLRNQTEFVQRLAREHCLPGHMYQSAHSHGKKRFGKRRHGTSLRHARRHAGRAP